MDRLAVCGVLAMFSVLALGQACSGCSAQAAPAITIENEPELALSYGSAVVPTSAITVAPPRASLDVPDTCDPLLLVPGPEGPRLSKQLPDWYADETARAEHQAEVREVITLVVDEMGGDEIAAEFLWRKAINEASGNPGSVHLHGGDIDAGEAWAAFGRANTGERWAAARVPVYVLEDGDHVQATTARGQPATHDAWAIGRGLYGMVTPLYVPEYLGPDAPPWALCDSVLASVVAIWSVRKGLDRCKADGLRDAYRWLSAGTCKPRSPEKERRFDRLAAGRVRGLRLEPFDPKSKADFGNRWPAETTDPGVLLWVIRERISQAS